MAEARAFEPPEIALRKTEKVSALPVQSSSMILIVMGVVGAGKTTVGKLLARQMGWEFADADDFHPASNVNKIRHGISLSDEDREPWLQRLRAAIIEWIAAGRNIVLAC